MTSYKRNIALFYLIFFISIKFFLGLHAFSHDDDHHDDCDVCEFVITLNTTSFTTSEQITVEPPIAFNYDKKSIYTYDYLFTQSQIDTTLFSRPPPTV